MSYPLSESFATAPAAGYTAVLGGMSATHNSAQQSIDISAPNSQSIPRFTEAAHGDFWSEADVELLTDPSARKHKRQKASHMSVQTVPTKACKRCKKVKPITEYSKAGSRQDGMQPWCKPCVKLRDHERYSQDKNKHRSWNVKRRDRYYDMLTKYLEKHPCVDCGEADPIVLEFDHRDPTIKDGEVTKMIGVAAWEKVLEEMAKCDVVC